MVKAIHIGELRVRIDAARLRLGLALFPWTDPVIGPGSTQIRSIHVQELRMALNQAYSAAIRPPPQYTDGIVAGETRVRAVHITELRGAVMALERP